ncbi:hypothetical protein BDV38DRAFT_262434, partial [Aspergillus pseudotamarii]
MIDKNRYGPRCPGDRPTRSKESEISEQGCTPNRDSFSASRRPHPNRLSRTQWVGIIVSSRSYTGREALAHFAAFDTFHTAFATLFTQETTTKGGQAGTKAAVTFFLLLLWRLLWRRLLISHGSLRCVLSGRRTLRRVTTVLLGRVPALRRTVVTGRRTVGRLGRIGGLLLVTH